MRQKIGTSLIIVSSIFLLLLLAPLVGINLWPQHLASKADSTYYIDIPKINASAPIITNVDPWNESEYQDKLKLGVAHATGTALPGESGTSFLFAHSSDWPWNLTRYNTAFFKLGRLEIGDTIIITKDNQPLTYTVFDKKVVWPSQVDYLDSPETQLILQTCTPPGTAWKRLLIFAKPAILEE